METVQISRTIGDERWIELVKKGRASLTRSREEIVKLSDQILTEYARSKNQVKQTLSQWASEIGIPSQTLFNWRSTLHTTEELKLPERVKSKVGELSYFQKRLIKEAPKSKRAQLATQVVEENLSTKQIQSAVRTLRPVPHKFLHERLFSALDHIVLELEELNTMKLSHIPAPEKRKLRNVLAKGILNMKRLDKTVRSS